MDKHIFAFWQKHNGFPCNFPMDYEDWQESWVRDIDGDGRFLFSSLRTELAFDATGAITGLIRYGKTAFGFDDRIDHIGLSAVKRGVLLDVCAVGTGIAVGIENIFCISRA